MEFLVHIEVVWPPDGDPAEKARLIAAESARAAELVAEGRIRRLWRIPGRWANFGLWEAPDATAVHAALSSLPFAPWCDTEVTALAVHPSDPGPGGPG
jgi:muconolactone D-isomerase